jgi:uncharacterized protein YecT (DUF1311 family)
MWTRSISFSGTMIMVGLAAAKSPCDSNQFNSHIDQMACEIRLSQQRLRDVDRAFAELMKANGRFIHNGGMPNLFTDDLKSNQAEWRAFTSKDCALQGAVSMGTAASNIEQQCLQDAYAHRIRALHQMASLLGN